MKEYVREIGYKAVIFNSLKKLRTGVVRPASYNGYTIADELVSLCLQQKLLFHKYLSGHAGGGHAEQETQDFGGG